MGSAAHEKRGPLVAGKNTSYPYAFSNLTAKSREHVAKFHILSYGLGIEDRAAGDVIGRKLQAVPFLGGKVNKLNGDVAGNTLANCSERLVTATFRNPLVAHFLCNARNAVFGQNAPNFRFEEGNLVVSTRLGVALGDAYAVLAKTKTALEQVQAEYDALKYELDWFKRQLFGQKSEKRLDIDDEAQLNLLAGLGVERLPSRDDVPTQTVTYERRAKVRDAAVAESGLRFGSEVPVQTIEVTDPAIEAIPQAEREVIGEKVSYRLAQQPGSYVVLKYVRKVVKRRDTQTILTAPAPANVLERSAADVSFLAAMLVDKFCWHLPLYRQHQRLLDAGITLSRSTLVYWASRTIDLLAPITDAQSAHVLASRVLAMDETSIKAGREAKGKMRTGWLWPVYGDSDEVVFHYAPSRAHHHVHAFLGNFRGTLLSDGYDGYSPPTRRTDSAR